MAAKDVPVVELLEEEEEEWPEAGAQNIEEAEQYVDHINNIFNHLSTLIHEDTKDALGQTIRNFKKIVTRQWETMGDADVDVILHTIKDPTAVYLWQHLTRGRVEVVDPLKKYRPAQNSSDSYPRGPDGQKRQLSSVISLSMQHGPMSTCQKYVQT